MRLVTRKPHALALEDGVVDGYLVENTVAPRSDSELICEAVGPEGEAVSLVIARRPPVDRHGWQQFRRSARVRATLQHEALVPVYAVGDHAGRPYLAMARYPEATFDDLLEGAPLPPRRVLKLLAPVCDALDLAHANGLVHQSLSGGSILVERNTVLLDGFGVAGGSPALTFESVGVHDVRYSPPEELRGHALEPASNLYSLASLLVHALTGTPPYEGAPAARAYGHLIEPPPRPSAKMPQLGAPFDDVIAWGMAKDPAERPGSACEWLNEAAMALDVHLSPLRGSGPGEQRMHEPPAIRIKRMSNVAVIAAVVAAVLGGMSAGVVLDPFDGTRASAAGPSADTRALERLDDQRALLRSRLSASETPQEQAATATELAGAYGRASRAAASPQLASAARAAEHAYAELGAAAHEGSADGFAAASADVAGAERRLAGLVEGPR
jgi:protein kinase-like protein